VLPCMVGYSKTGVREHLDKKSSTLPCVQPLGTRLGKGREGALYGQVKERIRRHGRLTLRLLKPQSHSGTRIASDSADKAALGVFVLTPRFLRHAQLSTRVVKLSLRVNSM
jgi:hypothetical protein